MMEASEGTGAAARPGSIAMTDHPQNTPPRPTESDLSAQIDALFADNASATPVPPAAPSASEHAVRAPEAPPMVPAATSAVLPVAPIPQAPRPAPAPTPAPAPLVVEEVRPATRPSGRLDRVFALAAAPLAGRPPGVRRAVGLIALNSLVLGVILWAWALFLRPAPEHAAAQPFNFEHGSVPRALTAEEIAERKAIETPAKDDKKESHGGGH